MIICSIFDNINICKTVAFTHNSMAVATICIICMFIRSVSHRAIQTALGSKKATQYMRYDDILI